MDATQVFAEIAARVDAGSQLDNVPGRAGGANVGPRMFHDQGRIYARGTPDFEKAREAGLLERLVVVPPATLLAVERAERCWAPTCPAC
jgi:hypothetical protein